MDAEPERRAPHQLPRGRHGLDRSFVVNNQRERILAAVAECCGIDGYDAVAVEDILARAGVSRRTFYDQFRSKADAFAAAYEEMSSRLIGAVRRAAERQDDPLRATSAALSAYLETLASEPVLARACLVDILNAGPEGLARRQAVHKEFVRLLTAIVPAGGEAASPTELLGEFAIGGLYEVVLTRVLDGQAERLVELLPDLAYGLLAPFVGAEDAAAERSRLLAADYAASARDR